MQAVEDKNHMQQELDRVKTVMEELQQDKVSEGFPLAKLPWTDASLVTQRFPCQFFPGQTYKTFHFSHL